PAEVLEQHYPVLFEPYALRERSGGAGRTRGGFGVDYKVRIRRGEALLSFLMDHGRFGPPGLFGGKDGATNEVVVERQGAVYRSPHWSKDEDIRVAGGDSVHVRTPGGGGYGDPLTRDSEPARRDVAPPLRLEWQPTTETWKRPGLTGFLYNDSMYRIGSVRLRVEALDAENKVLSETLAWAYVNVSARSREAFSVTRPKVGETFRITVESFVLIAREAAPQSP